MQRILKDTRAEVSAELPAAPDAGDGASATVDIVRADGSSVASAAQATVTGTTAVYTVPVAETAALDVLTASWTATIDGEPQTVTSRIEVVGGFHFTLAQARAVEPFKSQASFYPDSDIELARTLAELALEDECGVAFVPRHGRAVLDGNGGTELFLPEHPEPRSLVSVTIDGTALTADELADVKLYPEGVLYRADGWSEGRQNIEVVLTHGFESVPGRVPRAALALATAILVDSPISSRAVSLTNQDGTFQSLVVAGVRGAVFDIPEANAVVNAYGMRTGLA